MGDRTLLQSLLAATICWNIWKECNCKIFRDTFCSADVYPFSVYVDIKLWTELLSNEEHIRLSYDSGDFLDHLLTIGDVKPSSEGGGPQVDDLAQRTE